MDKPEKPTRLTSLDALRGFDMFWIIGGSAFVLALAKFLHLPDAVIETLATHFEHVPWEGFHFFDLIFPLFVFISGITIPFSILSKKSKGISTTKLQFQILKRTALLIIFGLTFSIFRFEPSTIRFYTVLWLIGMSYLIGASTALHVKSWKHQLAIVLGILVLYHLALFYLPYPGKAETITPSNNLAAYIDRTLITTNLYQKTYDPEGSIRVITGGALCLLGSIIGQRIKFHKSPNLRCSAELLTAGLTCLLAGYLWSLSFPIIKDLWSPSFILWSAGWSLIILSLFYTVLDVYKLRWLGFGFIPIGMNAITIYLAQVYLNFNSTNQWFFAGLAKTFEDPITKTLILTTGLLTIKWLLLYFLYRKKIFLRV